MGKLAFVFPGQGSQYAGMGREVAGSFSQADEVFREADRTLGFPLSELCFEGPEEKLRLTENTQPAILTASIATLAVLRERGYAPDLVAGHSLGEYSALVCAGALAFSEAVMLVRNRGRYMQEAVPEGRGAMAAVLGLESNKVAEACAAVDGYVAPANFNSPEQTVVAGEPAAVEKALDKAREMGAKRVMSLPVSAPFHCELMAPARDRLAADLARVEFRDLEFPLVCNVDATAVRNGAAARQALVRQVCAPVRWVDTVRLLRESGVETFVEVGPGRVLAGMIRKTVSQVRVFAVDSTEGIEALASGISSAKM